MKNVLRVYLERFLINDMNSFFREEEEEEEMFCQLIDSHCKLSLIERIVCIALKCFD